MMMSRVLRLVVFDLDYTIWQPEMYQLDGGPKLVDISSMKGGKLSTRVLKEAQTGTKGKILIDRSNTPIRVFEGAAYAMTEINRLREEGHDINSAVASRTDEPHWAETCMEHLMLPDDTTLKECFEDRIEIDCMRDKTHHLKRLHESTGIPYSEMCFFDNEYWNIECVRKLGVESIYTPNGMTRDAWKEALRTFGMTDW